jgi:hypothetical protein
MPDSNPKSRILSISKYLLEPNYHANCHHPSFTVVFFPPQSPMDSLASHKHNCFLFFFTKSIAIRHHQIHPLHCIAFTAYELQDQNVPKQILVVANKRKIPSSVPRFALIHRLWHHFLYSDLLPFFVNNTFDLIQLPGDIAIHVIISNHFRIALSDFKC